METLIEQHLGSPPILAALLFAATFVLEEAAILLGAGLTAAGELNAGVAIAAVGAGIIVSDWLLYGLGALAVRHRRMAAWIPPEKLDQGRRLLQRSTLVAGLLARLVPWLLFPVFVASGFFGVGFRRFAAVNGMIAIVYTSLLFFGAFEIFASMIERLGGWTWLVGAALLLALIWAGRVATRSYFAGDATSGD